jgi:hypothetical protein
MSGGVLREKSVAQIVKAYGKLALQKPRRVAARLLHKSKEAVAHLIFRHMKILQNTTFLKWAMLISNQRPLPCEGSTLVCWGFLEHAKCPLIAEFPC